MITRFIIGLAVVVTVYLTIFAKGVEVANKAEEVVNARNAQIEQYINQM